MQQNYRDIEEGLTGYVYIGTFIFLLLAVLFIIFLSISVQRRKVLQMEKKQLQSQYEQELLRTQLEIQEQTLKTISQEIHDNIGQVLSLAKLNLSRMDISKQDQLQEKIADSKKLVSKAIQDLRDLARSMNTDNITAMGLANAVGSEVEMLRKAGFAVSFDVNGNITKQDPQKELILFRIIQEVFNNVIKHAEANTITVMITYAEMILTISVTDNGKGVDLNLINGYDKADNGLGIRNMHNRARLIGADFKMSSTLTEGTEVILTLPINTSN